MKSLMILFLAWPSLTLAIPPGPLWLGEVKPQHIFEGRLLKVIYDGTVVTADDGLPESGPPARDRRTLKYWDLELGLVDTLDLFSFIEYDYVSLAMSSGGDLLAVMREDPFEVTVYRMDTKEIQSSFRYDPAGRYRYADGRYRSDRRMRFLMSNRRIALNEKGGMGSWDPRTGDRKTPPLYASVSYSDEVSPGGSTYCHRDAFGTYLKDADDRWTVTLTTPYANSDEWRMQYFHYDRFLASHEAHDWKHATFVWDLRPFPPHTPPIGEAVLVDSLGNPVEGLPMKFGHDTDHPRWHHNYYFEAVTDENGRIPLIVLEDRHHLFEAYYRWNHAGIDWDSDYFGHETRWDNIPLRHDIPFSLKLFAVGGLLVGREARYYTRPWEISGQRLHRVEIEIEVPGAEGIRRIGRGFQIPVTPAIRVFRSGYYTRPRQVWLAWLDSTERATVTISDSRPVTGLYHIELFQDDTYAREDDLLARWTSIPINEGRRNAFRLPIGGLPVWLSASDRAQKPLPPEETPLSAFPNPFNSAVSIRFHLPETQEVELTVYNMAGQVVKVLEQTPLPAGWHDRSWQGEDLAGREVASGIYLYRLKTAGRVHDGKIALVR